MPFKSLVFLLLPFILHACAESAQKDQTVKKGDQPKHHQHHANSSNQANQEMHRHEVAELIKRFESKERDEYQQPEKVLNYIGELEGKKVMDIGAGSGYFSVKLAAKGAQVIAADVNQEFLDHIEKRIEDEKLDVIECRKIPYDSPALDAGEVDLVLIVNTYHHIEDRIAYFKKVKDGLNKNGELVVIDFFKKELPMGPSVDHKISREIVVQELQAAGFKIEEVLLDLLPYQYLIKAT